MMRAYIRDLFKRYGHEKVLLVGFDVSKLFHYVGIVNGYGEFLQTPIEIDIYTTGYEKLVEFINAAKKKAKAKHLIFGCEPSGHYYKNLMVKLCEDFEGDDFVLVNPVATKAERIKMGLDSKTDEIDTRAILEVMVQGDCFEFPREGELFQSIKEHVKMLDILTKQTTASKNQIHAYLDEIYPGLEKKLSNLVDTQYGIKLLEVLPEPKRLKSKSPQQLVEFFNRHGHKLGIKQATKIHLAAATMLITKNSAIKQKKALLKIIVRQYKATLKSIESIEELLAEQINQISFTQNLMQISGISVKSLARFIAYLGNPYKFPNGARVSSFAGLNPIKNQSGTMRGRETISRVGHKKLRGLLVQMAHLVIGNVGYFTAYYNRLIIENGKAPKVAVVATANKLARVMMHMIHSNEAFCPPTAQNQALVVGNIKRLTSAELLKIKKEKKLDSLTQSTEYLTRV